MLLRNNQRLRSGATLVEGAIVYPVVLLLTIGMIVGGLGVYRYQQVASLAREGARYASVHGSLYATDTGNAAATTSDISTYVTGKATGLTTSSLTVSTIWTPNNGQKSKVSVTVSYPFVPEAYFGGVTLSSTSEMIMSY